jgi:MSHA pilin protein MshA
MKRQGGFTLIELVVVIVILGLLAAAALPRFIDVTSDARASSVKGVAGGLRAAAALAQAQYVVNGDKAATTVSMSGQTVTVLDENSNTGLGGRPTEAAGGIRTAMPDPDGFTISGTNPMLYTPDNGGSAGCRVEYNADVAGDPVTAVTGSC